MSLNGRSVRMCGPLISRKSALVPLVREKTDEYGDAVLAREGARRAGDGVAAGRFPHSVGSCFARSAQRLRSHRCGRENLVLGGLLNPNKDFEVLGSMVETLNKIACLELKQSAPELQPNRITLEETPGDLRTVLDPYCQEGEVSVRWEIPAVPRLWANRHRLLRLLLNLTRNTIKPKAW